MTVQVSQSFYRILERWVYEGEMADPFGEFFVKENTDVAKDD